MTNEANIDIRVDDAQVEQLTRSLAALQQESRQVAASFDDIGDQARQADRAMAGMRGSGSSLSNIRTGANQSSNAMGSMGRSAAGAARGLAAAGAAAAGGAIAAGALTVAIGTAVVAWEGLKIGVDQAKQALVAYVSQSEATRQQFNALKEAGSSLQLQFGRLVFEVLGGNDAFALLNELIEAGAQIIESLTSALGGLEGGLSATSIFLDLARSAAASLLDTLIFIESAVLKLSTAWRLVTDAEYGFDDRRRELDAINDTLAEQRRIVDQLRTGTLDLSRMSARDPIRLAVEGGSGGGSGSSVDENTDAVKENTTALDTLTRLQEEFGRKFDANSKAAIALLLTAQRTALSKPETQSLLDSGYDIFGGSGEGARRGRAALDRRVQSMEALEDQTKRILIIDADIEDVKEQILRLQSEEAELQQQSNNALSQIAQNNQQIARNRERIAQPLPSIPEVPSAVGMLSREVWQGALLGGAAAAPAAAVTVGGRASLGAHAAGALGRAFPSLAGQAGGFIAGMEGVAGAGGLATTAGRVVGGAGRLIAGPVGAVATGALVGRSAGLEYNRLELQREAAIEARAEALVEADEARVASARAELENARLASQNADLQAESTRNQAQQQALITVGMSRLSALGIASDNALTQAAASATDFNDSIEEGGKAYLIELDERREAERQYFDFVRQSIKGTKEEAAMFIDAISGTGTEEAFRNLAAIGAPPAAGLARQAVRGGPLEFTEAYPVRSNFSGFAPGIDREEAGFRGIGTEFESRARFLEAVEEQMTPMERRWAEMNGGVDGFIKRLTDLKEATRAAFKADAIDAFENSFVTLGASIGTALGGGFDDALTGAERAKAILFELLGSTLQALGSTAIAQGGIYAFGDPTTGGFPNPARAIGLIAAGTAAVTAGAAFSARAGAIQSSAGAAPGVTPASTPGGGGTAESTTNVFIENRFGNRFDAREIDRAAAESFASAAAAGQA